MTKYIKYSYFLLFLLFSSRIVIAQQSELKVLSYNALHGFSADREIVNKYINWLKKADPDLVLYQEMNGYSDEMMRNLSGRSGHKYYAIMNVENGYDVTHPLAISSKYPLEDVKMVLDNMWHGYIYAKVNGIHVFVTHLAPFTLKDRQRDLTKILTHARSLPRNEGTIIAGDFNSLSEQDSNKYDNKLLSSMRRIEGRLEPKSGTPIVKNRIIYRNNLDNGNIDYSVMRLLSDAGYSDSFYLKNTSFKHSVPTAANMKKSSKLRRIDYIWVNPVLAEKIVEADIIHDDITGQISDHYPVFVRIQLK